MDDALTGWWRANAAALGVLVLLVPATAAAVGWNEWSSYYSGRASIPIMVQAGESAAYGEATIGPATAEFTEHSLAPSGTRVVSVRVRVDPGDPAIQCFEPPLRELEGLQRQWNSASYELDRSWDVERPTSCIADATTPYTLDVDYLVPLDASGPFVVDIESGGLLPEFARLVVAP
ncbi:hypothetical protein K0817_004525 [Microbacterium sp. HD4P20]|uniref:hypothetical protein n=1 Tax=Microbacterium sp. HD4P20 TaxID=2864874 RepID=UPI001C63DE83|nr:hypothetical protein [Microbacterium sp. HD4P20]MCP2635832.1 hypothetical protein [Microbacterium sp. HD4P20]